MWSMIYGYKEVFEVLLDNKADIEKTDEEGMTPLMFSAYGNNKEMTEGLIKRRKG